MVIRYVSHGKDVCVRISTLQIAAPSPAWPLCLLATRAEETSSRLTDSHEKVSILSDEVGCLEFSDGVLSYRDYHVSESRCT